MKCPICNGTGKTQHFHRGPALGGGVQQAVSYGVCQACNGTGRISSSSKKEHKWSPGGVFLAIVGVGLIIGGIAGKSFVMCFIGSCTIAVGSWV